MTQHRQPSDEQIDQLVRAYLTARQQDVDPHAVLAGVRARLACADRDAASVPAPPPGRERNAFRSPWLWRAALAASLLLTVAWLMPSPTQSASAQNLVQAALTEVRQSHLDRCYLVEFSPRHPDRSRDDLLPPIPRAVLWTRGDRFWLEPADPSFVCGRDAQKNLWVVVGGEQVFRFAADEIPTPLRYACELRTLDLPSLLPTILDRCYLSLEVGQDGTTRITAVPKRPGWLRRLTRVTFEIDPESAVIRKATVSQGAGVVTFTYQKSGTQPDASYRPEGHVPTGRPASVCDSGPVGLRFGRLLSAIHQERNK